MRGKELAYLDFPSCTHGSRIREQMQQQLQQLKKQKVRLVSDMKYMSMTYWDW